MKTQKEIENMKDEVQKNIDMIRFGFYIALTVTTLGLCFVLDVTNMVENKNSAIFIESVALYLYSVFIAHNAKYVKWW